jgi:hypothetical protein
LFSCLHYWSHQLVRCFPLYLYDITNKYVCLLSRVWVWLQTRFGSVIGFIEHLQIVTIDIYGSLPELHTQKSTVTTAHTESSQFVLSSTVVAWWRIPTMSSASVFTFLPTGQCLTNNCSAHNISARTTKKTPFLYCCLYLRSPYSVKAVVFLLISWSLPNNWSTCHNIYIHVVWFEQC